MACQHKRKSEFSISTKTKGMRISNSLPTIKSLPKDLLIEVLAKVAASSVTDLFNTKLVVKDFLRASEDGHIFKHVSLRNFQTVPWKNNAKFMSFMKNCNNHENPEALYRSGMLEFFTHCNEVSGLADLKASAKQGHFEACYVYGVVLYSSSERLKSEEGFEFLKRCEAKMVECRRRVKSFVGDIWINNNKFSLKNNSGDRKSCDCVSDDNRKNYKERRNGWDWNDEDDIYGEYTCEACKWNGEVLRFCNMLRTGRYI